MSSYARTDARLRQAAETQQVPGVIAIATSADETLYESVHGTSDLATGAPLTIDSIFRIASMTKALAGAAAMKLVEEGKLDLDAPISKVLPALGQPRVLDGFAADGSPKLRDASRVITLRHLLTHTAGFAYEIWNDEQRRYVEATGLPSPLTRQPRSLELPLMSDPGTRWEYGVNIDWAGRAVEAIAGISLGTYLTKHFFDPLGMPDTGFNLTAEQRARLVTLHARKDDGSFETFPLEAHRTDNPEMGGGGLYGTARDYIQFIRMMLNGGRASGVQILKPETVALMGENHIGALNMGKMFSALPHLSNEVDFFPEQDKKWGLSYLINTRKTADGRNAGSLAWAGLFNTYYWIDPVGQVGGVVMTQLRPFADPTVLGLLGALERGVYGVGDVSAAAE